MRAQPIATVLGIFLLMPLVAVAQSTEPTLAAEQRMQARYPQPVRVGDLIDLPVLDDNARTLGYVREIVRTKENKVELIIDYRGLLDRHPGPIAVPLEAVGIAGRQISSLDMPRKEYAAAPTWRNVGVQTLPADAMIKIALARH